MAGACREDLSALRSAAERQLGGIRSPRIRTLRASAAPIYNVASSKNFRDQLGVTLNTAAAAMSGYPAINPKYIGLVESREHGRQVEQSGIVKCSRKSW